MELENLLKWIETVSASELTGFRYEENGVKIDMSKKKEKLQVVQSEPELIFAGKTVSSTVSYTHLDVYKRQVLVWAFCYVYNDK